MGLFPSTPPPAAPPAPTGPPSLEQIFGGALAASAYAKSVFTDAVDELIAANAGLDDVEIRATSEIDRLTELRDQATAQRRANLATIESLQDLIG